MGVIARRKFDWTMSFEFQEEMVRLGMCGLSLQECGDFFGVDERAWGIWCEHEPLTESRRRMGVAQGIAMVGEKLLTQVNVGKLNAIMFYLKTLGNFEAKGMASIKHTDLTGIMPAPPVPADPVEASKVYQNFMKDS